MLVLPVDLAGEQVVARLQLASLGHAADGGEEQGVGRRADGQRQQQHQHAAQDEVRAQEDHPPVDQQILAGGKGEVQRPFAAGQAVLVAVHQQREQEHQKAVRREEDGVDRQLHGDRNVRPCRSCSGVSSHETDSRSEAAMATSPAKAHRRDLYRLLANGRWV